jgi:murein DD-endopeptidase MepM/ murein hydrolase activator NlpD
MAACSSPAPKIQAGPPTLILTATQAATPPEAAPLPSATLHPTITNTAVSTATSLPTSTVTITPTILIPTPTVTPVQVCSPLQDVPIDQLKDIITNPYQQPVLGQEGFHPAVDLAFYRQFGRQSILKLPVLSLLPGVTAAVNPDRPPYGNMAVVETPLKSLPEELVKALGLSFSPPPAAPDLRLVCPTLAADPTWQSDALSLYVLYAHLDQPLTLKIGEALACGAPIGLAGSSGNSPDFTASGNPHLHLEIRLGPGSAVFGTMSHHNNRATPVETYNYCLWRVSGYFQPVDPLALIQTMQKWLADAYYVH